MAYMINARLVQGAPSLTLIDSATGEERLHWRGHSSVMSDNDWQGLFKELMLIACADKMKVLQRSESTQFGSECIDCSMCVGDERLNESGTKQIIENFEHNVVSLFKVQNSKGFE